MTDLSEEQLMKRLRRLEGHVLDESATDAVAFGSEEEPLPPAHHEPLKTTIQSLKSQLDMTDSRRVTETGQSVAHLRD